MANTFKLRELSKFNGGQVVGITKGADIKDISSIDSRFLHSMDFAKTETHLGMLDLFENCVGVKVPFLKDIYKNADVLYVNGTKGKFTYEIPMDIETTNVVEVVSDDEFLGIDGSTFGLKTTHPFRQNDIITYDLIDGLEMVVVPDSEVVDEGDGFLHEVTLFNVDDRETYLDKNILSAETSIVKTGDTLNEYSTQFSGLSDYSTPNVIKLEYQIGSKQGVEVSYTDDANSMTLNGSGNISKILNRANSLIQGMEGDAKDKYIVFGQTKEGKIDYNKMKVEKLLHVLAMAEMYKMLSMRMMFSKGGMVTGVNSSSKVNEGIYAQLRRGIRFTYGNVSELRSRLEMMASKIYAGIPIPIADRELTFKGGFNAVNLLKAMFKDEFQNTSPIAIDSNALPYQVLSGKDPNNLTFTSFAISKAFLNGIGNVEIIHDASMDYDFGDVVRRGYSAGYSKRSWSLILQDVTDPTITNVMDSSKLPDGVTVHQKSQSKNLYIVKVKDRADISFGQEVGRVEGQNVISSMKHMGSNLWMTGQVDAWIADLGRVGLIERADAIVKA